MIMPELRKEPIMGRWVIISHERVKIQRPRVQEEKEIEICPFCEGNEELTPPEIMAYRKPGSERNTPGWTIRVVPNKFPALMVEGKTQKIGVGIYDKMDGVGAHEVIIETTKHDVEMANMDDEEVENIFWVYRDRILDLKKDIRMEYILIFKNKGRAAGASQLHPHSQLMALPMVPLRVKQEMEGAMKYYSFKERCIYCDIISQEMEENERVVMENDDFLSFCPFASRAPFEVWIIPKNHDSRFEDAHKSEIISLAKIIKTTLKKLELALEDPSYNFILHTSPLKEPYLPHFHWHIEIMPKLTHVAGFEWGTGFYLNPIPPEEAAKCLKEVLPK